MTGVTFNRSLFSEFEKFISPHREKFESRKTINIPNKNSVINVGMSLRLEF